MKTTNRCRAATGGRRCKRPATAVWSKPFTKIKCGLCARHGALAAKAGWRCPGMKRKKRNPAGSTAPYRLLRMGASGKREPVKWKLGHAHHDRVVDEAARLDPTYGDAELHWGIGLMLTGRFAEAEPHFARALLLSPQSPDAHETVGRAYASQGRHADAIDHFRAALQLAPPLVELKAPIAVSLAFAVGTITVPSGRTTGWPPITPLLLVFAAPQVTPPSVEVLISSRLPAPLSSHSV